MPRLPTATQRSLKPFPSPMQDRSKTDLLVTTPFQPAPEEQLGGQAPCPSPGALWCLSPGAHVLCRWTRSVLLPQLHACSLHARCAANLYLYHSHLSKTHECLQPKTWRNEENGGEKPQEARAKKVKEMQRLFTTFHIHVVKSPFAAG